jgi:hypothetical protein
MINKSKEDGYSIGVFKQLPAMINKPMLILESKTFPKNGYVFYGEMYDDQGLPMMAALHTKVTNKGL